MAFGLGARIARDSDAGDGSKVEKAPRDCWIPTAPTDWDGPDRGEIILPWIFTSDGPDTTMFCEAMALCPWEGTTGGVIGMLLVGP